ncbi:HAD-like protein [Fomitopsis betulina]|nr:HAD-like protein [Fomitopsis betulina]
MALQRATIEYVIFDMDGLLIDSERVYTEVTNNLLAKHGKEMTWDIKAGLMGKPERQAAEHLLSFFPDLPPHFTIDHYIEQRRIGQDALWPTVQPLPGVLKLVQHLHKHHIPIAVATGSQRRNYEQKSAHLMDALFGLFEGRIVCADDGLIKPGRGKPHPDVFLVAASRMLGRDVGEGEAGERSVSEAQRAERGKGLVFEDAIPGVQAGKRAGMHVVWVPDANLLALGDAGPTLDVEQPDQMLNSLEQLVPEKWGLPPYDADPK